MQNFTRKLMILVVCLVAGAMLGGCSTIKLKYKPVEVEAPSCDKSVALYKFVDQRKVDWIGENVKGGTLSNDNEKGDLFYYTDDNVSDWISEALYTQLEKAGCTVTYITSLDAPTNADVIVVGEINKAQFKRTAMSSYRSIMDLKVGLMSAGQTFYETDLYGDNEYQGSASDAEKVMTWQLQDMMKKAVPLMIKEMQK